VRPGLESVLDRFEGRPLQVDVERRVDAQALIQDHVAVETGEEQAPDFFHEIA